VENIGKIKKSFTFLKEHFLCLKKGLNKSFVYVNISYLNFRF